MDGTKETIDVATIGEEVPLLEGIRTTRAIRRLKPDPVSPALVRKVCEAGTFAPSGGNRQPWHFVAVTDPERKAWFAGRYREAFHAYIAPAVEAAKDPDFPKHRRRNIESSIHLADTMHRVPVLLFVCGRTRRNEPQPQAIFPAIQNVLLACRAVGLGASLTTVHLSFGSDADSWLGLPEKWYCQAVLPVGWPEIPYKRPMRRPVDECLSWETWR